MILTEEKSAVVEANRRRYAELKAAGQGRAPRSLPPLTRPGEAQLTDAAVLHCETVPSGWYWSSRLARGEALRIVNLQGSSAVSVIAWNADDLSERINYADTVKVQWSASLRKGRVMLSDMGRVVFSIIEDTSGAHDAIIGGSTAESNARKYGEGFRNSRDNFILAAGKHGMARRDVPHSVTFFAPVGVDANGRFTWNADKRKAGDFVDLRAEMNLIVALSNCPHPLDPAPGYPAGPIEVIRFRSPAAASRHCREGSDEAARAFDNTDAFFLA